MRRKAEGCEGDNRGGQERREGDKGGGEEGPEVAVSKGTATAGEGTRD